MTELKKLKWKIVKILFLPNTPTPPKIAHNGDFPLAKSAQKRDFLDFSNLGAKGQNWNSKYINTNQNIF